MLNAFLVWSLILWHPCSGAAVQYARTHARTHAHTHSHLTPLWILSGITRVSRYQKKHSPTHTYYGRQSSLICFLRLLWSMASSLFNVHAWQSFFHNLCPSFLWSTFWPGTLNFILCTFLHPIIVFFFTAHAHTIATCFAVVPRLCHLILVFLSTLYLELIL